MERRTILILDSQLHRGGNLEQALNARGYNVFRTSRSREASKLLQVLQPEVLILAWEGEGKDFYTERAKTEQIGWTKCLVIARQGFQELRSQDYLVHAEEVPLIEAVVQGVEWLVASKEAADPALLAGSGKKAADSGVETVPLPRSAFVGNVTSPFPAKPPMFRPKTTVPSSRNPSVMTPIPMQRVKTPAPKGQTAAYPAFSGSSNRKREWRGSLDKLDIARLFSILMRRQASGQLVLSFEQEMRSIWLHGGTLISAESNAPMLAFPQLLVRDGLIKEQNIKQFPKLAMPRPGYRLQELGLIQNNQIENYNRLYSEQVVVTSFVLEVGTFQFIPTADDSAARSGGLELSPLIIQGVREGYSLERLLLLLGGEERIPQWFAHRSPESFLPLNSLEKRVLQLIDGSSSLRDLWTSMQIDSRVPYGLIYVLMILGFVTLQEAPKATIPYQADGGRPIPASDVRHTEGESTPNVPLSSARSAFGEGDHAHTPRSNPVLDPMHPVSVASVRNPTASYRTISPSRAPARPALQRPVLESGGQAFETLARTDTQEQSFFLHISQKYQQVVTEDYFGILEINNDASYMEIRRAYQRLKHLFASQQTSVAMSQETNEQLDEILQTIQEAYDVLGDPQIRELYRQNLDAS